MPAFMAVSGFLNFRMGAICRMSVAYRRLRQLLIPFFCWALIKILMFPPYSINSFLNAVLYPDGSFWFLWALFFISIIFLFGDWLAELFMLKQEIVNVGQIVLFVLLMVFADIRILGFQFISYYFLFYSLGYYLHKYNKIAVLPKWLLIVLTLLWGVLAWFWNMHELPQFLSTIPLPVAPMQYSYRFITATIVVYILLVGSPKWHNHETKQNRMMCQFGYTSLGIYTVHLLLMPIVTRLLNSFSTNSYIVISLSFCLGLFISWIAVMLLNNWKITSKYLLGKI